MCLSSILCTLLITNYVSSLNILGIYHHNGRSHTLVQKRLLIELANRGHNVTVISHFPEETPKENYHDINLTGAQEPVENTIPISNFNYGTLIWAGYYMAYVGVINCNGLLEDKQVQEFIQQKPKFDVILVELFNSDCALGIAHEIGGPVVGTTSHLLLPHYSDRFGIPYNPSYVSFRYLGGGTKPTLLQRIERILFEAYFRMMFWITQVIDEYILSKYFDDIPPLDDLGRNIKFALVYQNFVLTDSKLLPANVKEVGGYHVNEARPLEGNLKKFIDEAEHGVIYISFGSITNSSTFAKDKLQALIETIEDLPQRFVVKWDKSMFLKRRDKVYVENWFPQIDILGHPKTLAFMSHCGMASIIEAVHFGVPIVAVPLFGDQPSNAAAIEERGIGTQIQYSDITKDSLMAAFKKVLDPECRHKAKEISAAWKDRPMSALEEAVFWVEFAARHPTLSFRTRAADVPFYQYLFLDIIGIVLIVNFTIYMILKLYRRRTKRVYQRLISQKSKSKKE